MDTQRDGDSSRQDVRVEVFFPLVWRDVGDDKDLASSIENHRTCDRFTLPPTAFSDLPSDLTDLAEFKDLSPHIYTMWMSLERKLDYIIRLVDKETTGEPGEKDGYCVNLSAGGALLKVSEEVKNGATLSVKLVPPTFPRLVVEVMGKVRSVKKADDGDRLASMEFSVVNEDDREDLISYIFKRQREILRLKSD